MSRSHPARLRHSLWQVALLCGLAGCAGSAVPVPTTADATRGSSHFPGLTLTELSQGRELYLGRCGNCHALKPPGELPPEQWHIEVQEMRQKNGVKLSDNEAQALVRYLTIAASSG